MRYSVGCATTSISMMGSDFEVDIDHAITDYGSSAIIDYVNGGDPGWGPEWEIYSIVLREERENGDIGPDFEATGKLLDLLANSEAVHDAILKEINLSDSGYNY